MTSQKSRLDRLARRYTPRPAWELSPEQGQQMLKRLQELTEEHGGPDGLSDWLEVVWADKPPAHGVDRARLKAKVVAMARVMVAETSEARRQARAELEAIGAY